MRSIVLVLLVLASGCAGKKEIPRPRTFPYGATITFDSLRSNAYGLEVGKTMEQVSAMLGDPNYKKSSTKTNKEENFSYVASTWSYLSWDTNLDTLAVLRVEFMQKSVRDIAIVMSYKWILPEADAEAEAAAARNQPPTIGRIGIYQE